MEDLMYLAARYAVTISIENRSWGTCSNSMSASLSATAVAESAERKLTGHSHAFGDMSRAEELREEAVHGALARLRLQVEALEALK